MTIATLKVLSTHAAVDVLNELGPKFERAHGCRLIYGYDPAKAVKRQVENGAAFDVAIVTRPVFDDLVAQGNMLAKPRGDVGRSGLGLSVRQGRGETRHRHDRSVQAHVARRQIGRALDRRHQRHLFRYAARAARHRRGDARQDRAGAERTRRRIGRARRSRDGDPAGARALPVAGAQYVGPFPPELQLYSEFTAGVAARQPPSRNCRGLRHGFDHAGSRRAVQSRGLEPVV